MAFSKIGGKGIDVSTDIITEFNSTGIDDNATSTAITIAANNSVSIPNLHGNTTTVGNLTVGGDFIVQGNNFTIDADSLRVEDSLIQLAANNETSDVIDIGFFGHYSNDGNTALHTGFFRDASDEQYYLFNGLEDADLDANNSVTTIDRSGTGFALADLNTGKINATVDSNIAAAFSSTTTTAKITLADANDTAFIDINASRIGIGHSSSTSLQALQIEPTSGEAMRIDSDGNVGIGVTDPGVPLEILSNAGANALSMRARTNDDYSFMQFFNNAGTTLRGQIANHNGDFNFYTGSSGTIRAKLNTNGHLAIGNTNATYILDVDVGAPASSDQVLGRFSSQNGVRDIGFVWDDSASTLGIATLTNHALTFHTNGNSNERMRIDGSGNVGVGSSSNHAGARVVINDTPPTAFGSPMLQVGQETFTASGYYSIGLGYTAASYTEPPAEIAAVSTSSSGGTTADIVFGTRSVTTNTAVTERMRIDSSGKVLIGTDSGDAFNTNSLLRIQQASNPVYLQIKGDNDQTVGLLFGDTDDDFRGGFFYENTTDELAVYTNDAERMRIKSDGKIGIGNTAPLAMMQITGTGDLLRLESTNAGTSGAQLDLIHFSASPADGDTVGVINFSGYDAGNNPTQYASIKGETTSVSSEHGELNFGIRTDGSTFHHNKLTINRTHTQIVNEMGDGYAASIMLTPDGGTSDKYSGIAFKATFGSYPADTNATKSS